ncbi:MAG: hypothetical protein R2726_03425 [Acidimicrobiales bacterium]
MSYLRVGKRARDLAAVAQAKGITFTAEDPYALHRLPFTLFAQSDRHQAEHVLAARLRGRRVRGFDFPFVADEPRERSGIPGAAPWFRYEDGRQYGCVVVHVDADLPLCHVSPRGRRNQLDEEAEVAIDDPVFAARFQVWCDNPGFARTLLVPEVVELLVRTEGRFSFELHRDAVLCFDRSVKPEEFPPLMALVVAFTDAWPEAVWAAFGTVGGPDEPSWTAMPTPTPRRRPCPSPSPRPRHHDRGARAEARHRHRRHPHRRHPRRPAPRPRHRHRPRRHRHRPHHRRADAGDVGPQEGPRRSTTAYTPR